PQGYRPECQGGEKLLAAVLECVVEIDRRNPQGRNFVEIDLEQFTLPLAAVFHRKGGRGCVDVIPAPMADRQDLPVAEPHPVVVGEIPVLQMYVAMDERFRKLAMALRRPHRARPYLAAALEQPGRNHPLGIDEGLVAET